MASNNFDARFPCPVCGRLHAIRDCTRFLVLEPSKRRDKALSLGLCTRCLSQTHARRDCPNELTCRLCTREHNTLLHPRGPNTVWFSMTAMARLYPNGMGYCKPIRLLIDPTVPRSCISLEVAEDFRCRIHKGYTWVTLRHRLFDRKPVEIKCVVEDTVYPETPRERIDTSWVFYHPVVSRANLADTNWGRPYPYKMVLGSDAIPQVLKGAAICPPGQCAIQFTIFGPAFFGEGLKESVALMRPEYAEEEEE